MVACPICDKPVKPKDINSHIDSNCETHIDSTPPSTQQAGNGLSNFFQTPGPKRSLPISTPKSGTNGDSKSSINDVQSTPLSSQKKRSFEEETPAVRPEPVENEQPPTAKKPKVNAFHKAAPLAERMRPRTLDDVCGQELVGPRGILRNLIEQDRVPSMILWGGAGTGKTTIARCIASMVGSRFVEINSTSSGVGECKKIFAEARGELGLTGRKTIIFCDEIHRFSKSQQDVFLGPVESGQITLIGATTENPSFKVQNALLSRCRTFTLQKLTDEHIRLILERALTTEGVLDTKPSELVDSELIAYLAAFSDGDARTALNLLELSVSISNRPDTTKEDIKTALTKTLSIRGSDPTAALYYLARMIAAGEDPRFIARRIVIAAAEDVGMADNSMLSLATATYTAVEKIGMPECRIALGHCTVALSLAPKSTRSYRSLNNAYAALGEPGVASLPIPVHLRNAPTKLMKELGYGAEYKYNPNYKDGRVKQEYMPDALRNRVFMEENDLGTEVDPDLKGR
ncbi:hypothetical protein VE04_03067 [Pseudogymnoascus sp. 24MN13]|nr:hypothetical protein VE04_03067 [Pseudogymnoascus sp. 24MN13]